MKIKMLKEAPKLVRIRHRIFQVGLTIGKIIILGGLL